MEGNGKAVEFDHGAHRPAARPQPVIAFLGTSYEFPSSMLSVIGSELVEISAVRLHSLAELGDMAADPQFELRLVVLSQARGTELGLRGGAYRDAAPGVPLVVAYEDAGIARGIRADIAVEPETRPVRFLPMRCSVDIWLSMLCMMLKAEWVVPEELTLASDTAATLPASDPRPARASTDRVHLTDREREVLRGVTEGLQNKTIARRLGLSQHTVKLHLHNIYGKLGVNNRAHAAAHFFAMTDAGRTGS